MQAIETERSPGLPSFSRGRHSRFLRAVTQALQSMLRSASQRNFMHVMALSSYAALI
jgi:hypothetical protein